MRTRGFIAFVTLAALVCILFTMSQAIAARKTIGFEDQIRALGISKAVPGQLNYQGYLMDAADSSAVTATLEMTFRLFDSETKGAELWSETHPAVAVSNGLFQVLLGSVTPFPPGLFDGTPLWLQTEVGTEALSPRKPLVSVAYSQHSQEADHAVHADTAAYTQVAGMTFADSAAVADNAHHLGGQSLVNLDDRWVNEEDLDHLDAADGDPANAVSVDVAGRVGIGTTNPARNLHIYEDTDGLVGIEIQNPNTGSSSKEMITFTDENGGVAGIATYDEGSSYPDALRIYNNRPNGTIGLLTSSLERVRVNNDGKVGIGTTSPSYTLDVNGAVNATTYWGDGSNLTGIAGTADADWTISGSDMYSAVSGNVGIGTSSPGAPLEVKYDNASSTAPAIAINNANASGQDALDFQFDGTTKGQLRVAATGGMHVGTVTSGDLNLWTNNNVRLHIANDGKVGIGTTSPTQRLQVNGNAKADSIYLGSSSKAGLNGGLLLYNDGATYPVVQLGDHSNAGGKVTLSDTAGNWHNRLEPDVDGTGGFLSVYRNTWDAAFLVNGNVGGTEEPFVWINGSARSAEFYMGKSGDSSVVFPTDAISAPEILDEPGVSNSLGSDYYLLSSGNIDYAITSVSINIPGPGYVEVTGGCYLGLFHTNGTDTEVFVAIDKTSANASFTFPGAQVAHIPSTIATSIWDFPCTTTRLYEETTGGTKTYYLNAEYSSGASTSTQVNRSYIRATYYPTLYGTVTVAETDGAEEILSAVRGSPNGSVRGPEPRRRSITVEDHNARLEAEMAALRAELDALKEDVQNRR